jgi:hypothetical protein
MARKSRKKSKKSRFSLPKISLPSFPKVRLPSGRTVRALIVGALLGAAGASFALHKYEMRWAHGKFVELHQANKAPHAKKACPKVK